ncbi:TPR_REGION domain-containing protein, partial [Haematococcus lacustris]
VANYELAIRCYQRALEGNDPDGIALHSLAKLHQQRGDQEAAEQLYRTNLARLDQYASMQDTGRLAEAQSFCERLLDLGGPHKEKAKALA